MFNVAYFSRNEGEGRSSLVNLGIDEVEVGVLER